MKRNTARVLRRIASSGVLPLLGFLAFSLLRSAAGKRRLIQEAKRATPEDLERRDLYRDPGFDREMAERRRAEERLRIAQHRSG